MKATIQCSRCDLQATVTFEDSIPYCPACGKPIFPHEILSNPVEDSSMTQEQELKFLRESYKENFSTVALHEHLYDLAKHHGQTESDLRHILATDETYVYAQKLGCFTNDWIDSVLEAIFESLPPLAD